MADGSTNTDRSVRTPLPVSALHLVLLSVPALWAVGRIVARNPVGIPHIERLALIVVVAWGLAATVAIVLVRLGLPALPVVTAVFVGELMLLAGGGISHKYGTLVGWSVACLAVAIAAVVAIRLSDSAIPRILLTVLAVALISGPLIDGLSTWTNMGESELELPAPIVLEVDHPRDIYLVVVDGFPGLDYVESEVDELAGQEIRNKLSAVGFDLPRNEASYPSTNYSVPSLLAMDYPLRRPPTNLRTLEGLYGIVSGNNPLREALADNGYATHMVEAGWSGSGCSNAIDHCVPSQWLDDPMYFIVWGSLLSAWILPGEGFEYAIGSKASMDWLDAELPLLSENGRADFVFAHIMAPHPPFFLGADCDVIHDDARGGFFFHKSGVPTHDRDGFLVGQLECVSDFMARIASATEQSSILVFVADHGTDRSNQLSRAPETWSDFEIAERMNALVAIRGPDDCSPGDGSVVPAVMRTVLSCIGTFDSAPLTKEQFLFTRDWDH